MRAVDASPVADSWLDTDGRRRSSMSREQFHSLPQGPPWYEWCRGEAITLNQPNLDHQHVAMQLGALLLGQREDLAVLGAAEVDLPYSIRVPDLVICESWPPGAPRLTKPPLVVVEILSPSTRRTDLMDKATEYAEFGVGQYWIVDLEIPSISIQQNLGGNWIPTAILIRENPIAEIEIPDHGTVILNINKVVRPR